MYISRNILLAGFCRPLFLTKITYERETLNRSIPDPAEPTELPIEEEQPALDASRNPKSEISGGVKLYFLKKCKIPTTMDLKYSRCLTPEWCRMGDMEACADC